MYLDFCNLLSIGKKCLSLFQVLHENDLISWLTAERANQNSGDKIFPLIFIASEMSWSIIDNYFSFFNNLWTQRPVKGNTLLCKSLVKGLEHWATCGLLTDLVPSTRRVRTHQLHLEYHGQWSEESSFLPTQPKWPFPFCEIKVVLNIALKMVLFSRKSCVCF